jgi:hypothetical protein
MPTKCQFDFIFFKTKNPSLVCNFQEKTRSNHLIQKCNVMKVEVVMKNVVVRENGAKMWVIRKYSSTCSKN